MDRQFHPQFTGLMLDDAHLVMLGCFFAATDADTVETETHYLRWGCRRGLSSCQVDLKLGSRVAHLAAGRADVDYDYAHCCQ